MVSQVYDVYIHFFYFQTSWEFYDHQKYQTHHNVFLVAAKFCYDVPVELTPRNTVMVYCLADYPEMIEEYGDDNLFSKAESYFHKVVLKSWKDCMVVLQRCGTVVTRADNLHIISKCLNVVWMADDNVWSLTKPQRFQSHWQHTNQTGRLTFNNNVFCLIKYMYPILVHTSRLILFAYFH